jgi:hypothetical protein
MIHFLRSTTIIIERAGITFEHEKSLAHGFGVIRHFLHSF